MFGLFRKRSNPHRDGLRQDFDRVTNSLARTDPLVQMAVGNSINIANSAFIQRFGSISDFRSLPKEEKLRYIVALTKAEDKAAKERPEAAVGFSLFKMWIAALTEDDDELLQHFSKGLVSLSKKGDQGV